MGIGKGAIWSDCRAKAGLGFVCRWGVDFDICHWGVDFDVCHWGVDFGVCHWGVDFLFIKADDSCPEVRDFRCHSVADLGFIGASPGAYAYASRGIATH